LGLWKTVDGRLKLQIVTIEMRAEGLAMQRPLKDLRKEIDGRNAVREEAALPLLKLDAETAHLNDVEYWTEFERYFEANRHRFGHLWSDHSRGFLSNMGIWTMVRKTLREEFEQGCA
jgi:hypothetical protein